jgi:succinate-semialdehyde dehydrogenase / glutarate-semialdehyde dehydrogenase
VAGHVDDAVKKGAKTLTGGKRPEMQGDLAKGNFYEPTILGDATIDMKVDAACCLRVSSWSAACP